MQIIQYSYNCNCYLNVKIYVAIIANCNRNHHESNGIHEGHMVYIQCLNFCGSNAYSVSLASYI